MPVEFIVAGLGNPGKRYARTRHNLGFRAVEGLARKRGARWSDAGRVAAVARLSVSGHDVLLIQPLAYMNRSGDVLAPLLAGETLPCERALVVCDDFALPLGSLRLRKSGSDGGHNGLRSVAERLGTSEFPRLRLGVGPVPPRVDPSEFVLAEFFPEEEPAVEEALSAAVECIEAWVADGIDRAMSRFNTRREPPEEPTPS
jgi:PTH1 family peptidyl-tRNA hydrolase